MRAISTSWMRVGHGDVARASRASTTRPFSRRSVPSSSSERVTSSTKNGLPSALRGDQRAHARPARRPRRAASRSCRAISPRRERPQRDAHVVAAVAERMRGSRGGASSTSSARVVGTTSARKARNSSDAGSIQCRSSTTRTSGLAAPRRAASSALQRAERLAAPARRVERARPPRRRARATSTWRTNGSVQARSAPSAAIAALDLGARAGLVVAIVDAEEAAERRRRSAGTAVVAPYEAQRPSIQRCGRPASARAELGEQPRLADARPRRRRTRPGRARPRRARSASRSSVELALAADERREAGGGAHRDAVGARRARRAPRRRGRAPRLPLTSNAPRSAQLEAAGDQRAAWTRRSARRPAARASAGARRDSSCRRRRCSPCAGRRRCCPRPRARC